MKKLFALFIALTLLFSFAGCGQKNNSSQNSASASTLSNAVYEEKGNGKNSFYLDVAFEKSEKHFLIKTEKATVGEALQELNMLEGEQGDWGLYITSVCGEEHRYENSGKYWAFYADGQYASASVDLTNIKNGHTYALKIQ